jgi:hypothetical protein
MLEEGSGASRRLPGEADAVPRSSLKPMSLEPSRAPADQSTMGSLLAILFEAGLAAAVVLVFWVVFSFSDDLAHRSRVRR